MNTFSLAANILKYIPILVDLDGDSGDFSGDSGDSGGDSGDSGDSAVIPVIPGNRVTPHFLHPLAATASATKVLCSYLCWCHCLSTCLNCRRQFSVPEMDGITAYQSVLTAVGSFRFLRWVASLRQLASLSIKVS